MKVTVVIVTYNPMRWLNRCFDSLRNSSYKLNIIVVDNGSTDGSQDYIKLRYPEVELIQAIKNLGFGAANNVGIKKAYEAGADYVFLLNQDAWIKTDTIANLITVHTNESEYGVLSPIHLNGTGNALDNGFSNYINPKYCEKLFKDSLLREYRQAAYELPFVNAAAWLLSRQCIESVGGFNPSFFHYGEDRNYCQRVLYHGMKIGVVPNAYIQHDREGRTINDYFDNQFTVQQRWEKLSFSNPSNEKSYTKFTIRLNLAKRLLKNTIVLRFSELNKAFQKYRLQKSIAYDTLFYNRELSKRKGMTFL